jgi:hypothetical protein
MAGMSWTPPPEGAHTSLRTIPTPPGAPMPGTITRTWMQDREETLAARHRICRILWPKEPLRILKWSALAGSTT